MTRPLLNRRLDGLGNSIFGEMSARAVATASINLGQGFPDVDGPRSVADAAAEAILAGRGLAECVMHSPQVDAGIRADRKLAQSDTHAATITAPASVAYRPGGRDLMES